MKKKTKKNLFWKVYAIALASLTLLMGIALLIGYNVMLDYDEAQGVLQRSSAEIAAKIGEGDYSVLFENESVLTAPMVFERELYTAELDSLVAEGVTARKGFSTDRYTKPVYDIIAGGKTIASVHFVQVKGKGLFGFDTYEVEKIVPDTDGKYSVSVYLPEGTELFLNGDISAGSNWIESESDSSESLADNSLFEGSGTVRTAKYTVSGLIENPEIKVIYKESGAEAKLFFDESEKAWRCESSAIEILAPSNSEIAINGVKISGVERFISEKDIIIEEAERALGYSSQNVTMVRYRISGLEGLASVEITAKSFNGAAAEVAKNESSGVYEVLLPSDASMLSDFGVSENYLINRAVGYAKAVCNDGSKYDELLAYIKNDTEAYTELEEFWVTFSKHNSYWTDNEVCEELVFYNEELFSARVSLDYCIKGFDGNANQVKEYPTVVTFYYLKIGDGVKIVDYSLG